jgi:hypothetical protein
MIGRQGYSERCRKEKNLGLNFLVIIADVSRLWEKYIGEIKLR